MEVNKTTLVGIVLLIHMALTGIMLFRLFRLKEANGGQLLITFIALMIPILGPSAMIYYYDRKWKQVSASNVKKNIKSSPKTSNKKKLS